MVAAEPTMIHRIATHDLAALVVTALVVTVASVGLSNVVSLSAIARSIRSIQETIPR